MKWSELKKSLEYWTPEELDTEVQVLVVDGFGGGEYLTVVGVDEYPIPDEDAENPKTHPYLWLKQ